MFDLLDKSQGIRGRNGPEFSARARPEVQIHIACVYMNYTESIFLEISMDDDCQGTKKSPNLEEMK